MHRDEHVNVDEVSDLANQDLRHLNRLSQIAQDSVFFERCPQFASVFATEVGDVVSLSRHSERRSQCFGISGRQGLC